jgi:hypothetical protein
MVFIHVNAVKSVPVKKTLMKVEVNDDNYINSLGKIKEQLYPYNSFLIERIVTLKIKFAHSLK